MDINRRIQQVIDHYHLSKKEFAEKISVSKSTITMITKELQPAGAKVILNTLEVFEEVSCEWLIRGKGEMLVYNYEPIRDVETVNEPLPVTRTEYKDLLKDIEEIKNRVRNLEDED